MAGVGKAAATVAAGGGPEDPIADAAAASQLSKSRSAGTRREGGLGGQKSPLGKPGGKTHKSTIGKKTDTRRLLLTEFIVCVAVLGMGTLVPTPPGRKEEGMSHLLVKGTALSLLFFVLALAGSAGKKSGRAAGGIGGLVTVAYLVTSTDMYNILAWISSFYGKPGTPGAGVATASYSGEYAGTITTSELIGPARGVNETGGPTGTIASGGTVYA